MRRAEKAGFSALVLTVDAPYFGVRLADVRNKFELPSHLRMANFVGMGALEKKAGNSKGGSGINEYVASLFDPTLSWKDVEWLRSFTKLPIVLKGILRPDDAVKGIEAGASAIVVSNHGARQLDGVAATIDALPAIREAVGNKCEVSTPHRLNFFPFKVLAMGVLVLTIIVFKKISFVCILGKYF